MALLLAEEDLVTPDAAEAFQTSLFARIDGPAPLLNCYALGFPQVTRYDGQKLDTEQFVGTIKPGSGRMRDEYVVEGAAPLRPRAKTGSRRGPGCPARRSSPADTSSAW